MCNARGCRSRMHICRWITRSSTAGTGPALFLLFLLIVAAKSPRQQPSSATLLMLLEPGPRLRAELHAGLANSTVGESDSCGWFLHYLNYCHFAFLNHQCTKPVCRFERSNEDVESYACRGTHCSPKKKKMSQKGPSPEVLAELRKEPMFFPRFQPYIRAVNLLSCAGTAIWVPSHLFFRDNCVLYLLP